MRRCRFTSFLFGLLPNRYLLKLSPVLLSLRIYERSHLSLPATLPFSVPVLPILMRFLLYLSIENLSTLKLLSPSSQSLLVERDELLSEVLCWLPSIVLRIEYVPTHSVEG